VKRRQHASTGSSKSAKLSPRYGANSIQVAPDEAEDPAEGFPSWSKTLLLLVDYAIVEGSQRRLDTFVGWLDLARQELEAQVVATQRDGDKRVGH
jgi:hypothetical protein